MKSTLKNIVFVLAILNSASAFAMGKHAPQQGVPTPNESPAPVESSVPKDPASDQQADSSAKSGNDIFLKLTQESPNETPFQLLESLYNSGTPAKISDFPTYAQCANNPHFRPTNTLQGVVLPDTKKEDLKIKVGWVYVAKDMKWVISAAQPAKDDGPLFPISPAVPEKDAYFPYVLVVGASYPWGETDDLNAAVAGACSNVPSEATKTDLVQQNYSFTDTPDGAVEQIHGQSDGQSVSQTDTAHLIDGVIVQKMVETKRDEKGVVTTLVGYNYFWRAGASK